MKNTIHQIIATCLLLCSFLTVKGQVEKLEFISEGKKLNTYFYEATGTESKPTLLWLHGNPGGKEEGKSKLAVKLNEQGINVLMFNYQGLWGSEGEFKLGNAIKDLSNAMDLLTTEKIMTKFKIDTNQIYVGGYSFGSSTAIIGSMYDDRINKIIGVAICDHSYFGKQFMDPNSKIRGFLERTIDELFLPNGVVMQDKDILIKDLTNNIYKYDFAAQADKFQNKQLYFFAGVDDNVCPIEDHFLPFYRKLKELVHKNLQVTIEMCDHNLKCNPPITLSEILTKWIKK